jgi:3-oxoacyl-[acyl-carrier protein] reductase
MEDLHAVRDQIIAMGRNVRCLQFDIANREQAQTVLLDDVEKHGAYYGVVCNAGITRDNAFPAISGEDWDAVLHTNLDGF